MSREYYKRIGWLISGAAVLVALGMGAGYWFGSTAVSAVDGTVNRDRKPLYWYDPMVPNQHFKQAGKSPFMDMQLIPRYAEEGVDEIGIRIDPRIVQNLGVRLAPVERGTVARAVDAVGSITFNQRNMAIVQARANGFVTRVYARAPGDVVGRGARLVDLLVPEWAGAQNEFLALLRNGDPVLIDAARQRLVLLGMPKDVIATLEATGQLHTNVTVRTPLAGVVDSLEVREGMTVSAGATLAKINGLDTVWLEAAIPEIQAANVNGGEPVIVSLTAYPGEDFKGRVIAVLPQANLETRTLRVRIELTNPHGRLRPGMFAQVRLDSGSSEPALYVPSEAVIHTGTRTVVIVAGEGGRFIPTLVQTGREGAGRTTVLKGLAEGQKVVVSGQFLIDSEASLKGVLARLGGDSPAPSGSER